MGLGHEMAHAYDALVIGSQNMGVLAIVGEEVVSYSEIFAGNVENCLRYEHNLPLRIAYKIDPQNPLSIKTPYYFSKFIYSTILSTLQR